MGYRARVLFVCLIALQMVHGIEEYLFRFYELFPPARWLDSILPGSPRIGLVVITTCLGLFGVGSYYAVRKAKSAASRILFWIWITLGIYNGIAHITWAIIIQGYNPGLVTGILLLFVALWIGFDLYHSRPAISVDE